MTEVILPSAGWKPRPYQQPLWNYLEAGGKHAVAVWHRRAGKDEIALHRACIAAFERPATYWHMLPEYAQARKAIWNAINPRTGKRRIDEAFPQELRKTTREQEMFIEFKSGATWQVVGSDNFNSLVGSPPFGIVYSEWSLANPAADAYLSPILAENGGWKIFIYTARGRNHGFKTFESAKKNPNAFAELLTVEDTGIIQQDILDEQLANYIDLFGEDEGQAFFRQEYYCDWNSPLLGSFYGRLLSKVDQEKRVRSVPYDKEVPVYTAWDLGFSDDTAIWFYQVVRNEIHLIDYYASSGHDIEHYASLLKDKGYKYAKHWLPHDARAKTLSSGGRSIVEQLGALVGIRSLDIYPNLSVMDGIQAVRQMLPNCYFDETKTHAGLESLRQYQREFDEDKKAFRDRPRHDWTSHAADAFRGVALSYRVQIGKPVTKESIKDLSQMTLNDVWETQTRHNRGRI